MKLSFSILLTVTLAKTLVFSQFKNIEPPQKLGGNVNTLAEENFPIFSKTDNSLYFTRTFDESSIGGESDQDIWRSEREGEMVYSKGEQLKRFNNKYNNCIIGFNTDESKVYMINSYEGKKDLKKGISYADKKGDNWSKPKEIKIPGLDIEGRFYSLYMSKNGEAIIISFQGPNSKGEEDLYVCVMENGKWKEPKSMGNTINSAGYEISPFLSKNNDTLFFSSNGFGGEGEADIFYSVRKGTSWTEWSEPVNLGSVINSPKFDAYFTISENYFFWSSNRTSERSDIYYSTFLPPPPLLVTAETNDVTLNNGSDGRIHLNIEGGVGPYRFEWSNGSNLQDIENLPKGIYEVTVTDANGENTKISVEVKEPELPLQPEIISKENPETILFQTIIYFDLNSSYLNKENYKDLDLFISKMKDSKGTKLSVISHCDKRESDGYNIWLSKRRMDRTINYLVEKGINRSRITGYYKGEREPEVNCEQCSEEQLTKNRRTTINVIPF